MRLPGFRDPNVGGEPIFLGLIDVDGAGAGEDGEPARISRRIGGEAREKMAGRGGEIGGGNCRGENLGIDSERRARGETEVESGANDELHGSRKRVSGKRRAEIKITGHKHNDM